jgi:inosine-uridine nucleoside N-ribohydrolase
VGRGAAVGAQYARELLGLIPSAGSIPVVAGPEGIEGSPASGSDAARAIVAEALREDPLPLYFTCGGPLTNLAMALRMEPRIAKRMTLIWIGGGRYPSGEWEYNLATDIPAARTVIERSRMATWQVPKEAYRQM